MARNQDNLLQQLTDLFAELPGIGPRSAARIVTELLARRRPLARELSAALAAAAEHARRCPCCNTLTTQPLCRICSDPARDRSVICIVETPADLAAIENSVSYQGTYFVLMGRFNPMKDIGPVDLGMDRLLERIRDDGVREAVIATSCTSEGEATAHVLVRVLKKHFPEVRVTRLARGLPAGIEVEYTDAASLAAAVAGRTEVS